MKPSRMWRTMQRSVRLACLQIPLTIELELVALGFFFYYRRESFWSKNENVPMTSELNRPIESFSGIQTHASSVGDACECRHLCHTGRRDILARNVTTCQHFARSRLTTYGNQRYKRLIYGDVWPWNRFGIQLNRMLGVVYSLGSAVLLTEGENFIQDNPVAPSKIRRFQFSLVCFGCFCVFVYTTTQSKQFRYLDVLFIE